jgi:hypothetical protein
MRTDGQTDATKLIVAFRNFANAPNLLSWCFLTQFSVDTLGSSLTLDFTAASVSAAVWNVS